jgi:hypothetical protein
LKRGLILAAVLMLGTAGTASAANITQNTNVGTVYNTTSIQHQTYGDEMGGMTVVATLIDSQGGLHQLNGVWTDGAFGVGGVINWVDLFGGDNFNLSAWGDTYGEDAWALNFRFDSETYRLGSLAFDGRPGNTVFDTRFGGAVGTAGSSLGRDFAGFDPYSGNITATYSNAVGLNGAAPIGDLYTNFLLSFGNGSYEQGLGQSRPLDPYRFTLDTDNARTSLAQTAVPEPGSMMLLGTGLIAVASRMRRKKAA